MQPHELADQIAEVADAARRCGQKIEINQVLPYVSVDTGADSYFFQGHEAEELLNAAEETIGTINDNGVVEDVILWMAQGW